jgi:hypothetical protein
VENIMWFQGLLKRKDSSNSLSPGISTIQDDFLETPEGFIDVAKQSKELAKHNINLKSNNPNSKSLIREVR